MASDDLQTRLKEGMALLAKQDYDQAKDFFNDLLDEYPESAQCYYGLMMAELKANSFAQLEKSELRLSGLANFKRALSFSEPAFKARLEAIQKKNEEYIKQKADAANENLKKENELEAEKKVHLEEASNQEIQNKPEIEDTKSENNNSNAVQNESAEISVQPVKTEKPEELDETVPQMQQKLDVEPEAESKFDSDSEPKQKTEPTGIIQPETLNEEPKTSSNKKKLGIGALLIVVAAAAYFLIPNNKPAEEKTDVIVKKPAVAENLSAIDLSKPTKFNVNDVEFEMVPCVTGKFVMGSPENELGRINDETLHEVVISKAFLLGKYEVTQSLYEAVTGNNPSRYYGSDNPVDSVSYYDAVDFCNKLNELTKITRPAGYKFDLPTEAQWEYACRAGTTSAINNNKELTSKDAFCSNLDEVAWYVHNSFGVTHPVGQKQPNAWGLYDMHGNVGEWCKDWYCEDYEQTNVSGVFDIDFASKVVRGGNFVVVPWLCRSASRNKAPDDHAGINNGFRIVLVSEK